MQLFAGLTFHALVAVHLHTFIIIVLHGYVSLCRTSGPTTRKQLAVRFYPRWCYVRSGVDVSARRIGTAMNRFYTKQTKIFGPKNQIDFFSSEDKFRRHFNLQRRIQCVPKSIIGQTDIKLKHRTINQKLLLSSFICLS